MSRLSDTEFLSQLSEQPALRGRFESILQMSAPGCAIKEADVAEESVIEAVRQLGQEVLTSWAERQVRETTQTALQQPKVHRDGKKNSAGTARLGQSK